MKQKTMLYEALETAGAKAQYDEHVKRLLSFRPAISQSLIRSMTEYTGRTAEEAVAWIELDTASLDWGKREAFTIF